MQIEILKPGLLTTLQDAGRPGLAHLGIGRAGAFDAPALRIANALCGNAAGTCGIEFTLVGPTLRADADWWIAVTGAPCPLRVDGITRASWSPIHVRAGQTVQIGAASRGCRGYLAVRGGFDIPPVLGSRSTDLNAHLGPLGGRALRAGDVLQLPRKKPGSESTFEKPGSESTFDLSSRVLTAPPKVDSDPGFSDPSFQSAKWQLDPRPWFDDDPDAPLRLLPGSHLDHLTIAARHTLFNTPFRVDVDSNRTGVRLTGPVLELAQPLEMVSEGCVPGLVQLPPSGHPIIFGPEGPTSGGYPRLGQVIAVDLPRAAQRRPGDALRCVPCTLDAALAAWQKREHALRALEAAIAGRLAA